MATSFNVGVIGYGMAAKVFHIPVLSTVESLRLHAIVQRHPTPDDNAERDHPGVKVYPSTEEMVKDPDLDLVVVTTVPTTHVELAKVALNAKKHVLVEKPFTPTSTEADELISLAKANGCLLTVYQNRRWDSDFLTLKRLLESNSFGHIAEFETHFDRHRPELPKTETWKSKPLPASGAIYDLGTHLIDQVVHLFGLPQKVTGFVGSQRADNPGGYEDSCTVLLHYENGMLATVKAGVVSPETNQLRYWVRGASGGYKKYHLDCQEDQLKVGLTPADPRFGVEPAEHSGTLTLNTYEGLKALTHANVKPETYAALYKQLSQALAKEGPVPVEPEQARDVIRLIELARQSSKEGRSLIV